jgi:hypothetical protein
MNFLYKIFLVTLILFPLTSCNTVEKGIEDSLYVLPWNWKYIGQPSIKEDNIERKKMNPNSSVATALPRRNNPNEDPSFCLIGNNPLLRLTERVGTDQWKLGFGVAASIQEAKATAINNCSEINSGASCMAIMINGFDVCDEENVTFINDWNAAAKNNQEYLVIQRQREQTIIENREYIQSESQCKSFGFADGTPEMANCLLELYKIANQPRQSTQTLVVEPTSGNTADPAAAIELFNISRDILNNTGTRASPAPTSVRCTRVGDFSRQVYTFNIACPMGYVQSF